MVGPILEALERKIGLRRDATRAPLRAPEWQRATSMPRPPRNTQISTRPRLTYCGPKLVLTKGSTLEVRPIYHPSRQLKSMQRWFLAYVIEKLPIHPAAMAYRKHTSVLDNASIHAGAKFLLRMDCKQFFPSITEADLRLYIQERASYFSGWSIFDIDVFCKLVCRNSRLTIGAPTSPAISNVICYDMDA